MRLAALPMLLAAGLPARALDPDRAIDQYKHTAWTIDDGAPAAIQALAQTPDGYLWIGAVSGLYRFDGVRFEAMAPLGQPSEDRSVSALMATRGGELWVGYGSGRIGVIKDHRQTEVTPDFNQRGVRLFAEDRNGAIWILSRSFNVGLARYADGRWKRFGEADGIANRYVSAVAPRRDGGVWVATRQGLARLDPGGERFEPVAVPTAGSTGLAEDRQGRLWLLDSKGDNRPVDGMAPGEPVPSFRATMNGRMRAGLFDRDGMLWGITGASGLFRLPTAPARGVDDRASPSEEETYTARDGLTSDNTEAILEDREGNIWVGTSLGLDRFRAANVVPEKRVPQHSRFGYVLMSTHDGVIYAADSDSLFRIAPGARPERVLAGLNNPESLCEDQDGSVWLGTHGGLFRSNGGEFRKLPDPPKPYDSLDCAVDKDGTAWFALVGADFLRHADGQWSRRALPTPNPDQAVSAMIPDRKGGLLVAMLGHGLVRVEPEGTRMLWPFPAMPGGNVGALYQAEDDVLIGSAQGLARLRNDQVTPLLDDDPVFKDVAGLVQTPDDGTWVLAGAGITRISTRQLNQAFDEGRHRVESVLFDHHDGLAGPPAIAYVKNSAARGGDGRLWFVTTEGLVKIDPAHLARNSLPPPVVITDLSAGGEHHRDPAETMLPKGTANLEIAYTALSLAMPERVRFRYRLEGVDEDWVDPGQRRVAVYTNLAPGRYRFRVVAANNDGVWNETGASLAFEIPPTFRQSIWFQLLCGLGAILLLWAAYALRLRQVTARVQERAAQRLAERERIARDLHDTLLQGFQALMLKFTTAAGDLPPDHQARRTIEGALETADAVLIEGRDRVQSLRGGPAEDLAPLLRRTVERARAASGLDIRLAVQGTPRQVDPAVAEELSRIADEALSNAVRHSRAAIIGLSIAYGADQLVLTIGDEGRGIPSDIVDKGGRDGHFGLAGMRERARQAGGRLTLSSPEGGGTEIIVTVPARTAYSPARRRFLSRFRRAPGP